MTFRNHQQRADDVSHEHGTIYAKIKEEDNSTCTQFEAVATNITGVMYIDKTPEHENNHQDVLVLNLDNVSCRVCSRVCSHFLFEILPFQEILRLIFFIFDPVPYSCNVCGNCFELGAG